MTTEEKVRIARLEMNANEIARQRRIEQRLFTKWQMNPSGLSFQDWKKTSK